MVRLGELGLLGLKIVFTKLKVLVRTFSVGMLFLLVVEFSLDKGVLFLLWLFSSADILMEICRLMVF